MSGKSKKRKKWKYYSRPLKNYRWPRSVAVIHLQMKTNKWFPVWSWDKTSIHLGDASGKKPSVKSPTNQSMQSYPLCQPLGNKGAYKNWQVWLLGCKLYCTGGQDPLFLAVTESNTVVVFELMDYFLRFRRRLWTTHANFFSLLKYLPYLTFEL